MMRFILLISFLFVMPAQAKNYEPLPEAETDTVSVFLEQSQAIEKKYPLHSSLDFKMNLPKSFKIKQDNQLKVIEKNNATYGELYYAYGPSIYDLRSYFVVTSEELKRSISAKNWLISRGLDDGYTIKAMEFKDDNEFEAFYIRVDDLGRSEVIRSKGFLHENRLILVEYVVPAQLYEHDRDKQIHAIQSFEFLNEYTIIPPEKMGEYQFLDSFSVEYPRSWFITRKSVDDVNRHDVSFKTADENNFLFATAKVSVISQKSLKDRGDRAIYSVNLSRLVENKKEEIDILGFLPDPLLERIDYDLAYKTDINITEVYPLRRKTSDIFVSDKEMPISHEFWLTVIKTPEENGKNYVLSMVLPSRDVNFYQWALAAKSYEIMVKSVR